MTRWLLALSIVLTITGAAGAQPKTIDGVAIDPDAELIVAMPDDTPNMDPRIGMGSVRSTYIRQIFESLVDVDTQGKPVSPKQFPSRLTGETVALIHWGHAAVDPLHLRPSRTRWFAAELARRLAGHGVEVVCGPVTGVCSWPRRSPPSWMWSSALRSDSR